MTREKKMHENQRLGRRTRSDCAAQAGLSAPVTQSLMAAAAQPPPLSSAPDDLVSLCFFWKIELNDGKRRIRAQSHAPVHFGGRLARFARRQTVP
jgi:hypothetical protein